jgi:hypothetical protein
MEWVQERRTDNNERKSTKGGNITQKNLKIEQHEPH